jgi:hypothetical protein
MRAETIQKCGAMVKLPSEYPVESLYVAVANRPAPGGNQAPDFGRVRMHAGKSREDRCAAGSAGGVVRRGTAGMDNGTDLCLFCGLCDVVDHDCGNTCAYALEVARETTAACWL